MRVGVLGINHKLASLELRELLAKICHQRLTPGLSMHGEHHLVLLSTCNRTEVYFSSEDLASTHSYLLNILRRHFDENFDQKLYSYFGQNCLAHLCRVTTGLDSALIAETEIQGQVKNSYEHAQEHSKLPYELHYLFQKALGIAKKIRGILPTKPGLPDIEHAIFQTGECFLTEHLKSKVLIVGASSINEKILAHLKNKHLHDITICNRTYENAQRLAQGYQITTLPWNQLSTWTSYDWIILGTRAPSYLLRTEHLESNISSKLIIDIGVPRNADPSIGKRSDIHLFNIDQINEQLKVRREHMRSSLASAEHMIDEAIRQQFTRFQLRATSRNHLNKVESVG